MVHGASEVVTMMNGSASTALTAEELREILECEKIVHFRDAIVGGRHPRIKVPPQVAGKLTSSTRPASSPTVLTPRPNPPAHGEIKPPAVNTSAEEEYSNKSSTLYRTTGKFAASMPVLQTVKSGINPILLEKSEDLIKAEMQLQRQRVERALREQVEQRRISQKAALQSSESLPDFDISDVLSKALTIVNSSTSVEAEQSVGARTSSASDSFDEQSFYSSQHDTPEQSTTSHEHKESGEIPVIPSVNANTMDYASSGFHGDVLMSGNSPAIQKTPTKISLNQASPNAHLLNTAVAATDVTPQVRPFATQPHEKDTISASFPTIKPSNNLVSTTSNVMNDSTNKPPPELVDLAVRATIRDVLEVLDRRLPLGDDEPLVRAFDLEPVAPQPARVSPLATARGPPVIDQTQLVTIDRVSTPAAPAPLAALRTAPSSRDSSPRGSKTAEKKKGKKKKTGRRSSLGGKIGTVATPGSPYIKPEPLSPSPFVAAPLPRPHKRQRQNLHQGQELNYDEPRYDEPQSQPQTEAHQAVTPTSRYKSGPSNIQRHREPHALQRQYENDRFSAGREVEEIPSYSGTGRGEEQYRRVVSRENYRAPRSPAPYAPPYSNHDPRPPKAASHMVVERQIHESPRYYRESQLPPRTTVRPEADRDRSRSPRRSPVLMAPPARIAPTRIVVDEYGRQYYAPAPAVTRQSIAPSVRPSEEEYIYERTYAPAPANPRQSVTPMSRAGEGEIVYERAYAAAPVISRQSVAPPTRHGEEDYMYERAAIRAMPRPVANVYEQDGLLYSRPSPQYLPQRRVVTLPEHEVDMRAYRQRDYSMHPMPPPGEVRISQPERRQMSHFEGGPPSRLGSVRPEAVRYEIPREYGITRGQSVRPEVRQDMPTQPFREFSVRPGESEIARGGYLPVESRREAPVQSFREYSVRPGEPEVLRREYIPAPRVVSQPVHEYNGRPGEPEVIQREYMPPPVRRVVDEADYMERTRDTQQEIYADDVRREVIYR